MFKSMIVFLKGLWIGGTMTVPGVSGGSMAVILNIYDRLLSAVVGFKKEPKKNFMFLLKFALGAILGFVAFSKYILVPLMTLYPIPVSFFFLGAVAGGAPVIFKTAGVKKVSAKSVLYPIIGIIFVTLLSLIPEGIFTSNNNSYVWYVIAQIFAGILVALAIIVPGISVSQMLLMMGIYTEVLKAVDNFDILPFIPLGVGAILGCLIFAKIMDKAIEKNPEATYLTVFGFLLGSLPELFPGLPKGMGIITCIITFIAGFSAIYFSQFFENKK